MPRALAAAVLMIPLLALRASAGEDPVVWKDSLDGKAAASMGTEGARVFRNRDAWTEFRGRLVTLGCTKEAEDDDHPVDFATEVIVCVFQESDPAHDLTLRKATKDGNTTSVEVAIGYPIAKAKEPVPAKWNFACFSVPRAARIDLAIFIWHPATAVPESTIETARRDWAVTFDETSGDCVAGLRGTIKPAAATIQAGKDILIDFTLSFANPNVDEKGIGFAPARASVSVWDGKFSNGYRNHAFLVTGPDGKTQLLRPHVQHDWDKNAPHLEEVSKGTDYVLANWREGETLKSLKNLGLDTSLAGTYRITGMYMETGVDDAPADDGEWIGELYTNTVVVEVK